MRLAKGLLVGLMAAGLVGLVGCSGSGSPAPSGGPSPGATKTEPMPPAPSPASRKVKTDARQAAERFYGLYLARQFASSWEMLAPAAKHQIPKDTWVRVHEGCLSAVAGQSGRIKSVTVFGHAAIVAEEITGASSKNNTVRAVFNFSNGSWGYTPGDLAIYHHGSVSADIRAAEVAGFCSGRIKSIL